MSSILKTLNDISTKEKDTLKQLLLDRIEELESEKVRLNNLPEDMSGFVTPKMAEVEKLISYNKYLYHWIEDPPSFKLQ